jgi:hypothetical protein
VNTAGLEQQAQLWATPATNPQAPNTNSNSIGPASLGEQSQLWATPVADPAGGTAEQFLERKRKAVENGSSMGIVLSDLNLQAQTWATPNVPNGGRCRAEGTMDASGMTADGVKRQAGLEHQTTLWATPISRDEKSGSVSEETLEKNSRPLNEMAEQWKTPAAGAGGNVSRSGDRIDELLLNGQAENWATPCATDDKRGNVMSEAQATREKGAPKILNYEAALWATPEAENQSGHQTDRSGNVYPRVGAQAEEWSCFLLGLDSDLTKLLMMFLNYSNQIPIEAYKNFLRNLLNGRRGKESSPKDPSSPRQRLNPAFTEWLMNLPPGWVTSGRVEPSNFARWETACTSLLAALLS